jgi:SAM-dependent methyltransferase
MAGFDDARKTWDARFAQGGGALFGPAPNVWLEAQAVRLAPGARVLCIADGEGRNGVWLAERGCRVRSFDISPVAVEHARLAAGERGVALDAVVCSAADWVWEPDAYDAVAAVFVQFAPPDLRSRMFEGIARALVPGGLLILEGYGLRQLAFRTGGPGIAEHLYTQPMLLRAFDGWDVLASRDADVRLAEGSAHCGPSHVISMLLRKPRDATPTPVSPA